MTLFKELQRRNVLRVTVLYVVVAWVILQVAGLLVELLELPAWTGKFMFALILLGLPLVIIFAWAYEITPEGLKRESEVDRSQSMTGDTGRKLNTITVVMAAVAIALILAQGFIPGLRPAGSAASSKSSEVTTASIAVLPFANMSSDKEQDYFSDGLSEELLNLLANIPQLKVISRTSSFQFKGMNEDVREIGQKLGVAHVLEGSVRKSGETVRITAQLINTSDGSHVWSETYDRKLADIFAVQDEIAAEVVKNLELTLLGSAPKIHSATENTRAYNYYLQARHYYDQRTTESSTRAMAYLDSALAVDPDYALAWAEKSRVLRAQMGRGDISVERGLPQARETAQRALQLDPKLPAAYVSLASLATNVDWDWVRAEEYLKQAEALDPSNELIMNTKANLLSTLGRFTEALPLYRRAAERNPLYAATFANLGNVLARVDSMRAAATAYRKALELSPAMSGVHAYIGTVLLHLGNAEGALAEVQKEPNEFWRAATLPIIYHALGRKTESDKALQDLERNNSDNAAYQIAEAYAYRGQANQAFHWLERAYEQRDGGLVEIKGNPLMKNIVGDPRYRALLRKLRLPES